MRVLALDSTSRAGSIAVVDDDRVVLERSGDGARTHAERLPADILRLLDDAGVALSSVELFAIASGPGSFTGLRIGIATIQGMAVARGKRVVPVSTLDALAQVGSRALPSGAIVGAWMDAHRRDVFSALHRVTEDALFSDARLREIDTPAVGDPAETLARWRQSDQTPTLIVGDGAILYAVVVGDHTRVMAPPALAGAIGAMATHRARRGRTVAPSGVRPVYIRRPDAEIARESAESRDENSPPRRTQRTQS